MKIRICILALLVAAACAPIASTPSASPSPSTAIATPKATPRLLTFDTQHHYLDFTYSQGHLIFGGGPADDLSSSPDLIDRDLASGTERVLATAADRAGSIIAPVAGGEWVVFVETYQKGPLVYRVRAVAPGKDVVLATAEYEAPTDQQQQRARPIPQVATDGNLIAWTEVAGPRTGQKWTLKGFETKTSQRSDLYTSDLPLSFPAITDGELIFGEGDEHPRLLALRPSRGLAATAVTTESDLAQGASYGGLVAAKKGGMNVLDPGGLVLIDRLKGTTTTIVAVGPRGVYGPTINDRYVVWHGGANFDKIGAFDLETHEIVTIYAQTPAGRAAAYPGALIWLALRPEDVASLGTATPQFHVMLWP
jgi:hypothetical protein